jgi:uncharacterized protein YndB with AHSA1/START domain
MHELAARGEVQTRAPLHAKQRVTVRAPRARVWEILTSFAAWPSWQPNVTRVVAPAALAAGESFTWVNGKSEIHSKLALVQPDEQLAWSGSVSLAKAIHVWRLEAPTADTTVVEVEETLDGFLLTWFYAQRELDAEVARSPTCSARRRRGKRPRRIT